MRRKFASCVVTLTRALDAVDTPLLRQVVSKPISPGHSPPSTELPTIFIQLLTSRPFSTARRLHSLPAASASSSPATTHRSLSSTATLKDYDSPAATRELEDGWSSLQDSFTSIIVAVEDTTGIATITINRPEVLNALNSKVMEELVSAALYLDRQHTAARVIVITGAGSKAFAAGADIKEMVGCDYAEAYNRRLLNGWEALRSVRKPLIAAVNGYALGGGCELALLCDIIIAADTASLGQPELTLGVIPGMGGTQRLTHAIGKSRAMELILTGARVSAAEAAKMGLISRAVPAAELGDEVRRVASKIAQYSAPVVAKAKECVNMAFESSLMEGVKFEKHEFYSCFALADQKEGMSAFLGKKEPKFTDK